MKKLMGSLLGYYCLIVFYGTAAAGTQNSSAFLDTGIFAGEVVQYYCYDTLNAGPDFNMSAGSDVTLRSSGGIVLEPGFFAETGSTLFAEIIDLPGIKFTGTKQSTWPGEPLTLSWSIGGHDDPETALPPNTGIESTSGTDPVITLLPGIGRIYSQTGSIDVAPDKTTEYILRVDRGAKIIEKTFLVAVKADALNIVIDLPSDDDLINLSEAAQGLKITFTNDNTISSVRVFDSDGQIQTDITSLAQIDANGIFVDLTKLKDGPHRVTAIITDKNGTKTVRTVPFNLDKTVTGTGNIPSETDLILQYQNVLSGETREYFAYNSLTAGPGFTMEEGSNVSLRSSGSVDLAPGFFAADGSTLSAETSAMDTIKFTGSKPLVKKGGTVTLSWSAAGRYDNPLTTLSPGTGPGPDTVPSIGARDVAPGETTEYILSVDRGGKIINKTFLVTIDSQPPEIVISSPSADNIIDLEEAKQGLDINITDNTGITSVQVLDSDGQSRTDITEHAEINDTSIRLDLSSLKDGEHTITIITTDNAGNEHQESIPLELAKTPSGNNEPPSQYDLVLQNETLLSGETREYFAYGTLRAGPEFTMESGSSAALRSLEGVVLGPDFFAADGSSLLAETVTLAPIRFSGTKDLIKPGETIVLSWSCGPYDTPETNLTLGTGTSPVPVPSTGTYDVSPTVTTLYTLRAERGSGAVEKTFLVTVDNESPGVLSSYLPGKTRVNFTGAQIGLYATFTDNTGITSIQLFDVDGQTQTDITSRATVKGNTISYDLTGLEDGHHTVKVVASDAAGNETPVILSFELDKTIPVTTPSVTPGHYSQNFTVDLTSSEPATIFYSINGSTPFEGGKNTLPEPSPIRGITIDKSMNLQFFAKDSFGNIEPVQSAVYLMGAIPDGITGLSGLYNAPDVDLTWDQATNAEKYRVYRASGSIDHAILSQSSQGGYPPPKRLLISSIDIPGGTISFTDTGVLPGMTCYYAVTQVNSNGVEGAAGQIVSVQIPEDGGTADKAQAIARALAWLGSKQDKTGFWKDNPGTGVLATSQVLNAYRLAGKSDLETHLALFYLRGHLVDNNDFLSRKIITLSAFGQNTDIYINKLIAKGNYISNSYLRGWGINESYVSDPVSSGLGISALEKYSGTLPSGITNFIYSSKLYYLQSSESKRFGWIAGADKSVYASSLVYNAWDRFFSPQSPDFDSGWIARTQSPDGSLGNGVIDTSAALIWLDILTPAQKEMAAAYLVSRQNPDGSWNSSAYITGLCLEALLK
ncbi:MAG: chitobiase/beta-hexosaminidase C-terminal domain-containing protein [Desulfobacterales bacterium]|nr:chitobiase/beta-hexosaminidase C-terminal domain-containing protein [Desulfobacterales bacterium]